MVRYNFGVYHWRRRFRSVLSVLGALFVSGLLWYRLRRLRVIAIPITLGAVIRGKKVARRLLSPPPWTVKRYKYDSLAARLPLERANSILDIGCGTGRSLVGLAPHVPDSCRMIGLDVFDNRVILGNAPALAQKNARNAGIDATPVAGDAARLPLATDSHDVITACRVLHDLPTADIDRTLREAHRVCRSDGVFGILELPITPDNADDPAAYWRDRVSEAGFDIKTFERLQRKQSDGQYVLIVATPDV